tara:strand:+ start:504 stop:2180 length:1677 start_codon:yes stop_codon:yes gene_type:complete
MFLKQSTAYTFRFGPFLDDTDGKTAETGLSISQADIRLSKDGGNFAQKNESSTSTHDEIGFYIVALDATDTNTCGELLIACHESGALPVFKTFYVLEEAIYDAMFAASASAFDANARVDVASIEGSDATDQINAACDTALSDYDAPTKAELDSAFTEIKGGSWSASTDTLEAIRDRGDAEWVTATGFNTTTPPTAAAIRSEIDSNSTQLAAIVADTNELQGDWANGGRLDLLLDSAISKIDVVDGIVDNILVDTAEIGAAGAGLTAVPWNSAWDAEVQSECNDALVAIGLDHIVSASVAGSDIADNSIVAKLVSKESTADWDDFDNTTDSLQAIRDRGDSSWTTGSGGGGGGGGASAADIADAVWDEAVSAHASAGTFGKYMADILADTGEIGAAGAGLTAVPWNSSWDAEVQSECTDALNAYDPPTKAEMDAAHSTTDALITTVDTVVDAILVDTAEIGAAGAGLTAVPWNSAWDAEVQSECADALTAHWGATLTESYASDNAAATPAQLLHMIYCAVSQFSISGTTITGYKIDGSTTAMTWTLDDASNPVERKRAT